MVSLSPRPSAAWVMDATPSAVPELRRRAAECVSTASGSKEVTQAVVLAVSETVTNAVVHAYDGHEQGQVRVSCHADGDLDQQHGVGRDAWLLCSASGSEFNDGRVGRAAAVWLATHQRRQDVRSRLMAPSLCLRRRWSPVLPSAPSSSATGPAGLPAAVNSPARSLVVKTASDAEHVAARPGRGPASCRRSPGRGARPLPGTEQRKALGAASSERERWSLSRSMIRRPRSTAISTSTSSTIGGCGGDWWTASARSESRPAAPCQTQRRSGFASPALRFGGSGPAGREG